MQEKETKETEKEKPVRTPADRRHKWALMREFLRGSIVFFVAAILMSLAVSVIDMINPQIIRYTVDTVLKDEPSKMPGFVNSAIDAVGGVTFVRERLWVPALAIVAFALVSAVCRYFRRLYDTKAAETLVEHMRNLLFRHIERLPFSWHMKNQTGDIIQRCTSDVDMVKRFLSDQLTSIIRILILIVMSLAFMFSMNVKLALAATLSLPFILAYTIFFGRRISGSFKECDEAEGVLSSIAQENLTGVRVVRAFGREKYERDRFAAQNRKYTDLWVALARYLSAFWGLGDLISGLQVMLIIVLGSVMAVNGEMLAGEFIAFVTYNSMLIWPVRRLGRMISEMSKAGISIDRLQYIMDSPVETDREGATEPPLDGDIVFDDVSFSYDGCPELLHHISFAVKSGQTVGILGGTGSGKSTLIHLLGRLYEIPEGCGRITIGGCDIADMKAEHLRRGIGTVLQEPFLFSRSIAANIGITRDGITESEIRDAARIACLEETVDAFSNGFDTFVGERGVTLSGGQKQRAAIARMLTQKAPIMVFDDSLSAVDAETDAKIRAALGDSLKDSTVFLISHRTATLKGADLIIVLDGGEIAEMGTHETLMERENGIYRRIYEIQTSGGDDGDDDGDDIGDDVNADVNAAPADTAAAEGGQA